jgi:hypothetical protein
MVSLSFTNFFVLQTYWNYVINVISLNKMTKSSGITFYINFVIPQAYKPIKEKFYSQVLKLGKSQKCTNCCTWKPIVQNTSFFVYVCTYKWLHWEKFNIVCIFWNLSTFKFLLPLLLTFQ